MKKYSIILSVAIVFVILIAMPTNAQDQERRVRPAFPIGAGEKMLVISSSGQSSGVAHVNPDYSYTTTGGITRIHPIELPVGTTLKRLVGDFVDLSGSIDLTISLVRVSNADLQTVIVLRSFSTSGISSSSTYDFHQIVSNPLSHSMLQGWTYYINVTFPGGSNTNELRYGIMKLIYEP